MIFSKVKIKRKEECQVHDGPARTANKTLLIMILASLSVIIWHVWVFGAAKPGSAHRPFLFLLGSEIWDLLFDRHGIVAELWDVFPYFIVGILLAGHMRTYKIAVKLQNKIRRYGFASIFLASFVGILTPLCACGTLTTAISLLFAGLPLAPVMALLVTSPLLSPSTYLLTLNDLGPEWTVIRTVAAFLMGIFAGVVTHLLRNKGFRTNAIFIEGAVPRGDFHDETYPDERLRCNCKERFGNRVAARTGNMFLIFLAKSSEMLWLVGKYVLVGVVIGAIVERYLPREWIYRLFGQKDPLSIVWITLGSVPVFLHQISASSILYHVKSSLQGTLDGGAALAFMVGGPVTAIPTMVLFWSVFKKRVFVLYLFVCLAGTIGIAYLFQLLVFVPHVDTGNPLFKDVRSLSGGSASVITKSAPHVRIAMDPQGKSMIATRVNELEAQGGIVFDSGLERFFGSADRYDNGNYIQNAAEWLEQNNKSPAKGTILIYDISAGRDESVFSAKALEALQKQGFVVRITNRREMPVISEQLFRDCSQVWLLYGQPGSGQSLSASELESLLHVNAAGKSLLIAAGPQPDAGNAGNAVNELSSRYGVLFSGAVEHQEEILATTGSFFFRRASAIIGRILKLVNKA